MTSPIFAGRAGDISESKQDVRMLNLQTLIGLVEFRGNAWHRRDDLQGAEDNHYRGFIPSEDVLRRLFHWHPKKCVVAYLVPCDVAEATMIAADGTPVKVVQTQADRVGVLRDDNFYDLGVFRSGAVHPPYQVTLMEEAERLTGSILGISGAGLLRNGERAYMEFAMPETQHDPMSGFDYRPNLLMADSMDGSLSLTIALTVTATVCENTMTFNLLEAAGAGRLTRRKHTRSLLGSAKIADERAALGILEQVNDEFLSEWHHLLETSVSERQVIQVLDVIRPIPEEKGRARTLAENFRDEWLSVYSVDPMSAQWKGTAAGVVQADNTFRHHYDTRRGGGGRWEGNVWRAVTGKTAEADTTIVKALERVLA